MDVRPDLPDHVWEIIYLLKLCADVCGLRRVDATSSGNTTSLVVEVLPAGRDERILNIRQGPEELHAGLRRKARLLEGGDCSQIEDNALARDELIELPLGRTREGVGAVAEPRLIDLPPLAAPPLVEFAVSYTHLTLPTSDLV